MSDPSALSVVNLGGIFRLPSFFVYSNTNQTGLANNTHTKVSLNTELWDTKGDFASYKHTPQEPGKYLYVGSLYLLAINDAVIARARLYKNGTDGTLFANSQVYGAGASCTFSLPISGIVEMNGTTDYVEMYAYHNNGDTAPYIGGAQSSTWLFGIKLPISD